MLLVIGKESWKNIMFRDSYSNECKAVYGGEKIIHVVLLESSSACKQSDA